MINDLIFFDTAEDLEELTGLTHEELWNHGFNLDDMDCGFRVKSGGYFQVEPHEEFGYTKWRWTQDMDCAYYNNSDFPVGLHLLLSSWEDYCVGYSLAYHDGYVYVTLHHA